MNLVTKFAFLLYFELTCLQVSNSCNPFWARKKVEPKVVQVKSCNKGQILHEDSESCWDYYTYSQTKGPCGENMVLEAKEANSKFGVCKCERNVHPLVFIPRAGKCFKIFTQGPCSAGKWLEFNYGAVKCTQNPCQHLIKSPETIPVLVNGSCVQLESMCPLGSRTGIIGFNNFHIPECLPLRITTTAIGGIGPASCPPNFYRTPDGMGCQEPIFFDFD